MDANRWVSALRNLVLLLAGSAAGVTLTGVAWAASGIDQCGVVPLRFVIDGVDRTPTRGDLPDGNPASLICNGRTYVPLRWLTERLGKAVVWDGSTHTIRISSPDVAPAGLYPPSVRTGTPEVDRVIEAVTRQDLDKVMSLVEMTRVPCTLQVHGMPGLPPCPEGTPDGTPIEVFPASSCHVSYTRSLEGVRASFADTLSRPLYVYAVYRANWRIGDRVATSAIILGSDREAPGGPTIFLDDAGKIVGLVRCSAPSAAVPEGASFILPPKR